MLGCLTPKLSVAASPSSPAPARPKQSQGSGVCNSFQALKGVVQGWARGLAEGVGPAEDLADSKGSVGDAPWRKRAPPLPLPSRQDRWSV